ncbi:MAG: hypothetical protein ACRDJ1_00095 [Actinomycetota bacterium]
MGKEAVVVVTEERLSQTRRIDPQRVWTRRLAIAWVASIAGLILFEPVPTDANAAEPVWATVAAFMFLGALAAMAVGMRTRRRWAYAVSGGAGVLGMLLAYACLESGHHLGAWWMIELVTFGALTALSITAAERTSS